MCFINFLICTSRMWLKILSLMCVCMQLHVHNSPMHCFFPISVIIAWFWQLNAFCCLGSNLSLLFYVRLWFSVCGLLFLVCMQLYIIYELDLYNVTTNNRRSSIHSHRHTPNFCVSVLFRVMILDNAEPISLHSFFFY